MDSASRNCSSYFSQTIQNPLHVKKFLKRKDIDSKRIQIAYRNSTFTVYYEGRKVLVFTLWKDFSDSIFPTTEKIHPDFLNTGMGTVSYLLLARFIYLQSGELLASDINYNARTAGVVWSRLERLGLVAQAGFNFKFQASAFQPKSKWKEIDALLKNIHSEESFIEFLWRRYFHF